MKKNILICFLLFFISCSDSDQAIHTSYTGSISRDSQNIEYFGFALTDCGTNFTSQVDTFVNLVDICPLDAANISQRIEQNSAGNNKIMLHLGYLFIDISEDISSPSGIKYTLSPNYKELFNNWYKNNKNIDTSKLAAIYLPDEPFHNKLSGKDLETIAQYLNEYFPNTPLLLIEAYSSVSKIKNNEYIDWIGFDRYGTISPETQKEYLNPHNVLLKKMLPHQKLVIVAESQWIPYYTEEGFNESILKEMMQNYYEFARNQKNVVAIISYLLPSNFDVQGQKGFLDLAPEIQKVYKEIGKEIIKKS